MRALSRLVFACLALLAACAAPLTLPKEFVELRDAGDGYRAITSDDARLRVRDMSDETPGGVEFWAETLRADLLQRGYEAVDAGDVSNVEGATGKWFQFVANVQGERNGYFVALWVLEGNPLLLTKRRVRLVEFTAREDVFTARLPAVRASLATVRG
jgi:hypothetical protein